MATKIQLRRDTAADWTSANPTLAAGEFGYESDTTKFKIGDGSTAWNSLAYKTGEGIKVVADDSATITVAEAGTLYVQGGNNVTTSTDSAGVLTINATGEVTGSSTTTFTNKTFDAEGTGNALSNVDVANLKSGVLDTDLSSVSGSDDTLASAKAIKAYVDANAGGSTGDIGFSGNSMSTSSSNANLEIGTNGTGTIQMSTTDNFSNTEMPVIVESYGTAINAMRGVQTIYKETDVPALTGSTDRRYIHGIFSELKMDSSVNSSDSDNRFRNLIGAMGFDANGAELTNTSLSRGPRGIDASLTIINSASDAATVGSGVGLQSGSYLHLGGNSSGNVSMSKLCGNNSYVELGVASPMTGTITQAIAYQAEVITDGIGGTETISEAYGFRVDALNGNNKYAFYDATNSLSVFGDIQTKAIDIKDNKIKANRSNDSICIQGNGTGQVLLAANGGDYSHISTNGRYSNANLMLYQDLDHTLGTASSDRSYKNVIVQDIVLAPGQNGSDGDQRWRNMAQIYLEMSGSSSTATSGQYRSRGPVAFEAFSSISNNSSTAATLGQASGGNYGVSVYPGSSGDLTITNMTAMGTYFELAPSSGSGDLTITDAVGYESIGIDYYHGSGTSTMTDFYHFRAGTHSKTNLTLTNDYAFFTEEATAQSQFGAVRLMNQSGDPSGVADMSHIYAKDDGSSSEVYVRDEAGNVTKISPHNEAGEWEYYSKNSKTGKTVRINMEKLVAEVEKLSGKSFIESE
tara:strand:+ start:1483 stop:3720 length:2238 start_codon:yes stop_codon:yes gene_type:complete